MSRWSTHPDLAIIDNARNFDQNGYFLQTLVLPEHVGCHVDAPAHFHQALAMKTIDTFALDCVIGPAKKVDISRLDLKPGDLLTVSQFERAAERSGIERQEGDIALIEFGWDKYLPGGSEDRPNDWGSNDPGFSEELCGLLSERRVKAVGTDTVSADLAQKDGVTIADYGHRTYFLPRDILIIEGLQNLLIIEGWFMTGHVAGVTPVVIFLFAFIVVGTLLLMRTPFGRRVYAVGNSLEAARLSGVPTGRVLKSVYILCGLCAAIVGILLTGFSGQASLGMGDDYMLPSVAVVVVGGALITGGRGHYLGMVGGALLLTALQTLLAGTSLPCALRAILFGCVVLVAVNALRERGIS